MDKIKRFIDCIIDTETCNLRCHYCYIAQLGKFNKKITKFGHSKDEIRKALSQKRLGGPCLINLCAGGETLLSDEIIPVVTELLKEGHYIMIVTNGTLTNRFKEIAKLDPELLSRLFFKFSFHYLELVRLNWLDKFFDNIQLIRHAGASFTVEITPSDELIPYIEDVKKISMDKLGALPHITIGRDDRTKKIEVLTEAPFADYKKIWGQFHSNLFAFKSQIFYQKRKEFCYAGDWSIYLNLTTGDVKQCYCGRIIDNIYKNIDESIKFEAIGNHCTYPHCYNGHAFLALGDIPDLEEAKKYSYADLRNRKDRYGEWLTPTMKSFMGTKLYKNNQEYNKEKKKKVNRYSKVKLMRYKVTILGKKAVRKLNEKQNQS